MNHGDRWGPECAGLKFCLPSPADFDFDLCRLVSLTRLAERLGALLPIDWCYCLDLCRLDR